MCIRDRVYIIHRIVITIGIGRDGVIFLAERIHRHKSAEGGIIHTSIEVVNVIAVQLYKLLSSVFIRLFFGLVMGFIRKTERIRCV